MSEQRPDTDTRADPASPTFGEQGAAEPRGAEPGGPMPRFEAPREDPFGTTGFGPAPGTRTPGGQSAGSGAGTSAVRSPGVPKGPPSGPPARVGSAVASLVVAILTLIVPAVFWLLGIPLLTLLVNIPGIAFAAIALSKTESPSEVERFIRYSWASTIIYLGLIVVIGIGIVALVSAALGPS